MIGDFRNQDRKNREGSRECIGAGSSPHNITDVLTPHATFLKVPGLH